MSQFLDDLSRLYFCPVSKRDMDPLRIRTDLIRATGGRLWSLLAKRASASAIIAGDHPEAELAMAELQHADSISVLIPAARKVFQPEGAELTDAECLLAVDIYLDWCDQKKSP